MAANQRWPTARYADATPAGAVYVMAMAGYVIDAANVVSAAVRTAARMERRLAVACPSRQPTVPPCLRLSAFRPMPFVAARLLRVAHDTGNTNIGR